MSIERQIVPDQGSMSHDDLFHASRTIHCARPNLTVKTFSCVIMMSSEYVLSEDHELAATLQELVGSKIQIIDFLSILRSTTIINIDMTRCFDVTYLQKPFTCSTVFELKHFWGQRGFLTRRLRDRAGFSPRTATTTSPVS